MATFDIYETDARRMREHVEEASVLEDLTQGRLTPTDYARPHGAKDWRRIGDLRPFAAATLPRGFMRRRFVPGPPSLDLTPRVDVSFLLLLFFMLTATYTIQKTLEIPTPDSLERGARLALCTIEDLRQTNIIVRIDAESSVWIEDRQVPVDELARSLRSAVRDTGKTDLVIRVDDDAVQETLVAVIDAANEAAMERIRIATKFVPGSAPL